MKYSASQKTGTLMSAVQRKKVQWLWFGRMPLGKITVLDGDPGLGKSVLTLDIAARVSTGREMPDGTPGVQGGVVLLSAEDDMGDTVRPRLEEAGANLERIVDISFTEPHLGKLLSIPLDMKEIENAILRVKAKLVVIDPIFAFLGDVDTNKDTSVRTALAQLAKLAERRGVAVILVRHLNKGEQTTKAIYRGSGSIALVGLARSGLLVAKSKNSDKMVLASTKCNLAPPPESLYYTLESLGDVPQVWWHGAANEDADQLITANIVRESQPTKVDQAETFIACELLPGPMPSATLEKRASEAGIADKTYQRAKERLGVKSEQKDGYWVSSLPPRPSSTQPDSQVVR